MSRLLVGVLLAVGSCLGLLVVGVATASAYTRIDNACILRAYQPFTSGTPGTPGYTVSGEVDCGSLPLAYENIEVCPQVYNNNGNWYFTGTCGYRTTNYQTTDYLAVGEGGVCDHVYRSWDQGNDSYSSNTATYHSSGFTDCSQPV